MDASVLLGLKYYTSTHDSIYKMTNLQPEFCNMFHGSNILQLKTSARV
jgi:hypothetical protein